MRSDDPKRPPGRTADPPGAREDEPSLPASRAFVVQFGVDADPAAQRLHGRIEHIASGWSQRFASLEELVGFVARALRTVERKA